MTLRFVVFPVVAVFGAACSNPSVSQLQKEPQPQVTPPPAPPPEPAPPEPLRIGMSGSYLPMHAIDEDGARGFEAEIGLLLGKGLDRPVEFVDVRALGLGSLDAVAAGEVDLALSSITATPARDERVDFTQPYTVLRYRMATLPDAGDAEGPVAASSSLAKEAARAKGRQVVEVRSSKAAIQKLRNGEIVGYVAEDVDLVLRIAGTDLVFSPEDFGPSPIAAAIPEGVDPGPYNAVFIRLAETIASMKEQMGVGNPPNAFANLPKTFRDLQRLDDGELVEGTSCHDAGNRGFILEEGWVVEAIGRHHDLEMSERGRHGILSRSREGDVYTIEHEGEYSPLVIRWPVDGNPDLAEISKSPFSVRSGAFRSVDTSACEGGWSGSTVY